MNDYSLTLTLNVTGLQSAKHAEYVAGQLEMLAKKRGYKVAANTVVTQAPQPPAA